MTKFLLFALILSASSVNAQLTTVSELVLNGDGTLFTGEVVIAVPPFSSRSAAVRSRDVWLCSSLNIITGCAQQIINGVLTVALLPNGGGSPSGTSYFVSYYPDVPPGRRPSVKTEYWVVPAGGPYTIDQVKTSTPPVPTVQISPAQLNPAGYGAGQYPCAQTGAFAPCGPATGGVTTVTVDPSGACSAGVPLQFNRTNGKVWGCKASTWTVTSTNAVTVNGAAVPAGSALIGSNAQGQLIVTTQVPNHDLKLSPRAQGASGLDLFYFVTLNDGQPDTNPGLCAIWGGGPVWGSSTPLGMLSVAPCLTDDGNGYLADGMFQRTQPGGIHVSQLGTCNSLKLSLTAFVNDALPPAFLGVVTGGGSTKVYVYCNGSAWVAF